MIKSVEDEIKSLTEAKNEAALAAAKEKLKEAMQLKSEADKRLDDAKKASQPKDVNFALISTPVKLKVLPAPFALSATDSPTVKPGGKQAVPFKLDRQFGFADPVDVTFAAPTGIQGISASNVTLTKGQDSGQLEIVA